MVADNLSVVFDTLNSMNATLDLNATNIINNAITLGNTNSDGWIGILVLGALSFAIMIHLHKNRNQFKLFNDISLGLLLLNIVTDLGFILYQYRILQNIQILIFLYTTFVIMAVFSMLKNMREEVSN